MEYELAIESTPSTIAPGTGILLLYPSTGETDRIDTDFLKSDTDFILIISTRTTATEIEQKLDYYDVDGENAIIVDTLSVERGYSRRLSERVHYLSAPDDLEGILDQSRDFFDKYSGKLRVSLDSITELSFFAGESGTFETIKQLVNLIDRNNAVGLFHMDQEVHDAASIDSYVELFDGVVRLHSDGSITSQFSEEKS